MWALNRACLAIIAIDCFKHVAQIKRALGISAVINTASAWSKRSDDETGGADRSFAREDDCVSGVCRHLEAVRVEQVFIGETPQPLRPPPLEEKTVCIERSLTSSFRILNPTVPSFACSAKASTRMSQSVSGWEWPASV